VEISDVTRAIAAAASVAASVGLLADDAIVLSNSNKLALRLTPCEVLARVAHAGQEVAQFEVELAQRLAEAGCPVGLLELLDECRQLVLAMLAAWRWELGDQFPNGRRFGEADQDVVRSSCLRPKLQ
jgi:hypothetical protein